MFVLIVHITYWMHKKDNKSAINAKCLFYVIEIKEVHNSSHPLIKVIIVKSRSKVSLMEQDTVENVS